MIRQDAISKILLALAIAGTIYLATYSTTTVVIFPAILLLGGLGMEILLERHKHPEGEEANEKHIDWKQIAYYSLISLMAMLLIGFAIQYIPLAGAGFDSLIYTAIIGISEEQFFRGFITDSLLSVKMPLVNTVLNPYLALMASAAVFTVYHNARYGSNADAMLYVFFGGFILSWVAYKSRRLSPSMIGHALNNIASALGV